MASPKEQIEAHLQLIAAGAGIPQRILYGSERGELASTQDQTDWETTITSRQQNVMTPLFVRQTIDRLIAIGVLPVPQGGEYEVVWPPSRSTNPIRQAEIAERMGGRWRRISRAKGAGRAGRRVPGTLPGAAGVPDGGLPAEEPDDEEDDEPVPADDEEDEAPA